MKKNKYLPVVLAFAVLLLNIGTAKAQAPFITVWNTNSPGTSAPNEITIPTNAGGYNYDVQWASAADPTTVLGSLTGQTGDVTITFPAPGIYEVSITGDFPAIFFSGGGDKEKILEVKQWGDIAWVSMWNAFNGASNLQVTATDAPDLSAVTTMRRMFAGASSFNSDLNHWDVSNVTDMGGLFFGATAFNGDVSGWDVSSVFNMGQMFQSATAFDGDLGGWDVSGVTNMSIMFAGASAFTGTGLSAWDVGAVQDMSSMFAGATVFNADISGWDVSSVTSMASMFIEAAAFNGSISGWDVSNVTRMSFMFMQATTFNQPLMGWDVSNVTTMERMFSDAAVFNGDLTGWDVSNVTTMLDMFGGASAFTGTGLSGWDVSQVATMNGMFRAAAVFNGDLSGWDVSSVTDMQLMFYAANAFDQDLGGWDISAVTNMENMLSRSGLTSANYDATLIGWSTQAVQPGIILGGQDMEYCAAAERQSLIDNHGWTFTGDSPSALCAAPGAFVTTWNTNVTGGASGPTQISIPTTGGGYNYDIQWVSVADATVTGVLAGQTGDVTITFPAAGTYTVSITGDFPRIYFNNTGDKVKIRTVEQWGNIAWTSMENAFHGAENLQINAADAPDLSGVTSMGQMFAGALSLNSDFSHWDVSGVTDMNGMFDQAAAFNGDVSGWNVSAVTDMTNMLRNVSVFDHDLSGWDITAVTDMTGMLDNTGLSRAHYDALLNGWAAQGVQTGVALGAAGLEYCAEAERQSLIDDHGWVIAGDVLSSSCLLPITGVTFADGSFVYDGTAKSLAIGGTLPAVTSVSYVSNSRTDAGSQTVTANISGGGVYEDLMLTATLTVTPATITGITFADGSFVYDGTTQSLAIGGTLPAGATVSYADNSRTEAGSQTATASISGGTNYDNLVLTATLTVTPATITGITFADGSFVYDGTARSLAISGTLPAGTTVSYADNSRTDAGSQTATASISGGTNYDNLVLTATLTVTPATITGITFSDGTFVYDGTARSLAIGGTLPAGTTVSYADNSRTDAGIQTATATISGGTNYDDLVLTATLTVTQATITGITFSDGTFVYDGTVRSLAIVGTLPAGASVSYTSNNRIEVGNQPVTATIHGGTNYTDSELIATLTILPSVRTLAFAALPVLTYGDADHTLEAESSSGEAILFSSSNETVAVVVDGALHIVGAGTAVITATVPENPLYENTPSESHTLIVNKAPQVITFHDVPTQVNRDAGLVPLDVSASSGLPVSLSIDDEEVAILNGKDLDILRLGTIRITATQAGDANYASAEAVVTAIRVIDPTADIPIRIHKALSPNGDGINEYLIIEGIKDYPKNRVNVFNRNGTVVWEASGYNNGTVAFRGIGAGQLQVPAGTYFYIAEIEVEGEWKYEKGWFVLRY